MRPGDARALPGRADRGVRLSRLVLRRARLAAAPPAARRDAAGASRRPACKARASVRSSSPAAACSIREAEGDARGLLRERTASRSAETQAGKSALPHDHPLNLGAIGVTGTGAANALARQADLVLAVGTRLQDFTTGSWALFADPACRIVGLNMQAFDAGKHRALPLVADAKAGLAALDAALGGWAAPPAGPARRGAASAAWLEDGSTLHRGRPTRPCRATRRSSAPCSAQPAERRRGLRRRRPAGRTAQAVAGRRARRLPHGIRLFLHGLRDRRRARRQARRARRAKSS